MSCIGIILFTNNTSEIITILIVNEIRCGLDECGKANTGDGECGVRESAHEAAMDIS